MRNPSSAVRKNRKLVAGTVVAILVGVVLCIVSYFGRDFGQRGRRSESPPQSQVKTQTTGETHGVDGESPTASEISNAEPADETGRPVVDTPSVDGSQIAATRVLRVILAGIAEDGARETTVTLSERGGTRAEPPAEIFDSWVCQGLVSEFDLDPTFVVLAERGEEESVDELVVAVEHPGHFFETKRVPLSSGVKVSSGQTVYEVRVELIRPEYGPPFTLSVRDAGTRAHLEDVELRVHDNRVGMAIWGKNGTSTLLCDGVSSPIALLGGHDPGEVTVAALGVSSAAGEPPSFVELTRRFSSKRGVMVSVRAPGYAWGSISLDVSEGDRELLLEPAAALNVQLTNVQLDRYAALETVPMLRVDWIRADGGNSNVHFEPLDERLATRGLQLDSLVPGGYRVAVELGGGVWAKRPVLALEELSGELALSAGDSREIVLALVDPPEPPARATLGGIISFPAPTASWGEEKVQLHIYFQPTQRWRKPDIELSLADLTRVPGALPTWSFRWEDLPVGMYRFQLMPFLKVWMIELEAGGREDLELVLPEIAEVVVETVDRQTGELVPRDQLHYRNEEPDPRQRQNDFTRADTEESGRFRFWAAPGKVMVWPKYPSGADRDPGSGKVFELIPGLQSVKVEVGPAYAMRFEFREGGVALPVGDPGMFVMQNVRAVGHEGRVARDGLQSTMRVEVSAPGVYEIHFDGLDSDRYHPIPPRRVDVHAGEASDVIVELRRK